MLALSRIVLELETLLQAVAERSAESEALGARGGREASAWDASSVTGSVQGHWGTLADEAYANRVAAKGALLPVTELLPAAALLPVSALPSPVLLPAGSSHHALPAVLQKAHQLGRYRFSAAACVVPCLGRG